MTTTPTSGAADRCQACFDRNDGFYGSFAPPCPHHDEDGQPRASHGQAPAQPDLGTLNGLAKQYADSYASPHHFTLGVNGLRQIIQRALPQAAPAAQADSVLEDAARLDYLVAQRAYVVSDEDCCDGYWLHYVASDGVTWVQMSDHATPRAAIDAAMTDAARATQKEGETHDPR